MYHHGFCLFAIEATLFCLHPRVELNCRFSIASQLSKLHEKTNGQITTESPPISLILSIIIVLKKQLWQIKQ